MVGWKRLGPIRKVLRRKAGGQTERKDHKAADHPQRPFARNTHIDLLGLISSVGSLRRVTPPLTRAFLAPCKSSCYEGEARFRSAANTGVSLPSLWSARNPHFL